MLVSLISNVEHRVVYTAFGVRNSLKGIHMNGKDWHLGITNQLL